MTDKKPATHKPKSPEIKAKTDAALPKDAPENTPEDAPENTPEDAPENNDPIERGGPKGPEPTRFGDWENNGRCTDF
jgi:hypothetical protein